MQVLQVKRNLTAGHWTIFGLLLVGLAAGGFAWWHQFRRGHQVLTVWGADEAARVRLANTAELWVIRPQGGVGPDAPPPSDGTEHEQEQGTVQIGDQSYRIVHRRDVSKQKGFVHARQALIQDATYQWPPTRPEKLQWRYALRFVDDAGTTVILLDLENRAVLALGHRPVLRMREIADGFARFFADVLQEPSDI